MALMIVSCCDALRVRFSQPPATAEKGVSKNLLKIHIALEIFANEHLGSFPVVPGAQTAEEPLDLLVPHYTVDTTSFICPGSKDSPIPSGESIARRRISYAYVMGRRLADSQEGADERPPD